MPLNLYEDAPRICIKVPIPTFICFPSLDPFPVSFLGSPALSRVVPNFYMHLDGLMKLDSFSGPLLGKFLLFNQQKFEPHILQERGVSYFVL